MKLVYKNIIVNIIASILILFAGEFSLYFLLKTKIQKEAVEHLYLERHFMMKELNQGVNISQFQHNIGDVLDIKPIPVIQYKTPVIEEVEIREEWEEEHFTSSKIIFDVNQDGKNYRVSIFKTIDEDEGLGGSMVAIIFISSLCMLVILISVNIFTYYKLFSPLSVLIRDIKHFSVQQLKKITPPKTSTTEFIVLGKEISKMSEKIISDYTSIKEFTENMTHEIQTPLAVINSKIERCLQDKNLTEEQAILLSDAAKSVSKLFHINKGLTLISKLENQQFDDVTEIHLKSLVQQRINYLVDFIENKNITLTEHYHNDLTVSMKMSLAEILIDNLIKNAIQHNVMNGSIIISIESYTLKIANTGEAPKGPTTAYFDRFYSQKPQQSLGLGLAIIKKIVEYYHYKILYIYENNMYQIVIDFKKNN